MLVVPVTGSVVILGHHIIWLEAKKVMIKNTEPWPEEEQALKDIKTGKTQMVTQKSEDDGYPN